MSTHAEVAVREIPTIEKFRQSLDQLDDKSDLEHVLALTDAAMAYAKVTKSVELMNNAVELRLWTERRAGEIVAEEDPAEIATELHTRSPIVKRWVFFSSVSEKQFSDSLAAIRSDRDLSISGMFEHIVFWFGKEVATGVRKFPDGRYRISWRTLEGEKKTKTIDGPARFAKDLRASYVHDENMRKIVHASKTWKRLDVSYARVRRLLAELDAMTPSLNKHVRAEVDAAMSGLHTTEDALARAMKAEEVESLADQRAADEKTMIKEALDAAEKSGFGQ